MEIKINNFKDKDNNVLRRKSVQKSSGTTFQSILNKSGQDGIKIKEVKIDSEIEKKIMNTKNKIMNSSEAKHIDKMLKTDICKGNDKYFEKNGTLNVRDLIIGYGNNISDKDLKSFEANIRGLWKQGLIDDENYFYGLKWIEQRILSGEIKNEIKYTENTNIDNLK